MVKREENVEEIIEKKVQKKIEEEKESIKEETREEIKEELNQKVIENIKEETNLNDISRRDFLKKIGFGAAGLGVLSISPTAANLKLTKNGVFANNAQVGKVSNKGDLWRLVDRKTPSDGTSEVQFTDLSDDVEYKIFYTLMIDSSGNNESLIARLNNDGSSTGNYTFWDSSGTKQTSQNEMLLAEVSNNAGVAGNLNLTDVRYGNGVRQGFNNKLMPSDALGRVSDFGREGARHNSEGINSIEILATNGMEEAVIELWERDYS